MSKKEKNLIDKHLNSRFTLGAELDVCIMKVDDDIKQLERNIKRAKLPFMNGKSQQQLDIYNKISEALAAIQVHIQKPNAAVGNSAEAVSHLMKIIDHYAAAESNPDRQKAIVTFNKFVSKQTVVTVGKNVLHALKAIASVFMRLASNAAGAQFFNDSKANLKAHKDIAVKLNEIKGGVEQAGNKYHPKRK
jgi:uncharacterized protein YdcH (DUF465 family)